MVILVLVIMTVFSVVSLVSGASYLLVLLPGGLPAGNAIAALGLIAPASVAFLLSAPGTALRAVASITLLAAIAWLPVSIALAGNMALNFAGSRGSVWAGFTLVVLLAALGTVIWSLVGSLIARRRRASAS